MSAETAARFPIRMLESGPAAGAHAASVLAQTPSASGTSSRSTWAARRPRSASSANFAPQVTVEFEAARIARFKRKSGLPVRIPVVDLIEIGAGGGSIARVDELGLPAVGPRSAGSEPGPACYARGGARADRHRCRLGARLPRPASSSSAEGCGSTRGAAKGSPSRNDVGHPLGMSAVEAAWTVYRQVNEQMARAAAVHASEHGVDLRRFTLLAFGGAGPIHAAHVARSLGIRRVVVPPDPGVLSALGAVLAPPRFDLAASYRSELERLDLDRVNRLLAELECARAMPSSDEVEAGGSRPMPTVRWSDKSTCGTATSATRCRWTFHPRAPSPEAAFPTSKPTSTARTRRATGARSAASRRRR